MSESMKKQVNYSVACVNEFARANGMSPKEAFMYLYDYKGIAFLEEFYDVEHTLSMADAIEDLIIICRNNGGYIQ